jgi:EAL and modified HD-GYP domain-containing signal transduction protein
MLYGADSETKVDPLAQQVMHRADFMERLAQRVAPEDERLQQEAYLSALLSLAHIPQGVDAESFINGIAVSPEIRAAIIGYGGWLGSLLKVAERVERGEFPTHEDLQALFPGCETQISLDGLYF